MIFADLGLSEEVLKAVADAGYETPTPIQEQAIPVVLMGRDILGCAQTGTGKTASFTLPMIDILSAGRAKARMPRTLILEPTRELAAQVSENFKVYGKYRKLSMALLIGGVSMDEQIRIIDRGPDVLIATPGRLMDLFDRGKLLLNDVKILVIDEADRMLDMGFIPDVERIVGLLPTIRQTLFFSATMPREIRRLADAFLMNPKEISVAPPATAAETVIQRLVMVHHSDGRRPGGGASEKRAALRRIIDTEDVKNALVFCNRKRDIGILHRSMTKHGYNAGQLHGDMTQPARMETLDRFKRGEIRFLVCSDVAARGLDIVEMSHVFNYDVPSHAEDYIHRIGRTGRAGREGRSYTLATREDSKYLDAIKRLTGMEIPQVSASDGDAAPAATAAGQPARKDHAETKAPDKAREDGGKRRGRRGRGRGERRDSEQRPAQKSPAEPRPAQQKHAEPRQPVRQGPTEPREERPARKRQKQKSPFGEGDHVPAFLKRPV